MAQEHNVLRSLWRGGVICKVVLNAEDVVAPAPPEAVFVLLKRQSLLPLALREAIETFRGHVMEMGVGASELWFEAECGPRLVPLNWHLPAGVLYDLLHPVPEDTQRAARRPWRIIVHLRGLPEAVVPRCTDESVKSSFFHAIKQAMYVESGSAQRWFQLSVAQQDQLYQGLKDGDADVFLEPHTRTSTPIPELRRIPVRVVFQHTKDAAKIQQVAQLALRVDATVEDMLNLLRERGSAARRGMANGVWLDEDWRLLEAWRLLMAPDRFLYVIVS